MRHWRTTLLCAGAVAAALLLGACAAKKAPAKAPLQAVEAVEVGGPSQASRVRVAGALGRRAELALAFRSGGVLVDLPVQVGDSLAKGQLIAAINPSEVRALSQQARAELERAQRDVEGDRALFAKGYVSRQRLQDRERALAVARAAYEATAFDERSARIYAPATSVVLEKKAEVGEVVQVGQAVVRIADTSSPVVLRASLPSRDVERVRVGDRAWVHLGRSQAAPVTGVVTRLGQQSDSLTGAVLVEIQLNPGAPATRSGEIVHAEIEASAAPSSKGGFVSVPAEALVEVNGDKALIMLVTDGGMAKTASAQFGGLDGDNVLLAGLPAGSRVIIAGAGLVADGQQVKVVSLQRREGAQLASLR